MKVFPFLFLRPTLALSVFLAGVLSTAQAGAETRQLTGHVPRAAIAHARLLGRVAPQEMVALALTLPLRNQAGLDERLRRLYTPGDPLQGQYLTLAEFTAQYGPTAEDYAAVAAFARRSGLTVTGTHPNRLILNVAGPASTVETALGVRLRRYQSVQGRVFRAPDAEPVVPATLAGRLAGVVGLDTVTVRRPRLRPALGSAAGSGRGGGLTPGDIRAAYSLQNVGPTGSGQAIALFELDGYTLSDIRKYEATFGLPAVPLQNILVDGAPGTAGQDANEVTLDIELAQALAPNLSSILVYQTPNQTDANILNGYNRIATDNIAKQVSTSWGAPETLETRALLDGENAIFQQMAAQGQSILSVSGDNGAYDDGSTLSLDDPGSQPYVTGVGGTTLSTNGTGGSYLSETAWGDTTDTTFSPKGSGGGGGFSAIWPVPSYQTGLKPTPSSRSVPDVALDSDPNTGYSIYFGGTWQVYGGTSTAAPIWASFVALVNSQRAAAGQAPIGFLNPTIYQIGASAAFTANFHDITAGDNLFYPATVGYDNATGWGSPIGSALLNTLVNGLAAAETGTVTGTVTAADTGTPLVGVAVTAVSTGGGISEGSATTGPDGSYTLVVPSSLALDIRAEAYAATGGAYAGARAGTFVGAGQVVSLSFALNPAHTFAPGLQMISVPYDYSSGLDFATLFGVTAPLPAAGPRLARWSPAMGSYLAYPTSPVNTLFPGFGYWARFASPSYLHFDGPLVPTSAPFLITLPAGWNQIGDPFRAPVPLSSLMAGGVPLLSSSVASHTLYRYDTTAGAYAALNPAAEALQPYTGYWIYANQSTTLAFPPPSGQ